MTEKEVVDILKFRVKASGGQNTLAWEIGISTQYLGDVLNRRRSPGPKILKYLSIEKEYVQKERKNNAKSKSEIK